MGVQNAMTYQTDFKGVSKISRVNVFGKAARKPRIEMLFCRAFGKRSYVNLQNKTYFLNCLSHFRHIHFLHAAKLFWTASQP